MGEAIAEKPLNTFQRIIMGVASYKPKMKYVFVLLLGLVAMKTVLAAPPKINVELTEKAELGHQEGTDVGGRSHFEVPDEEDESELVEYVPNYGGSFNRI